MVKQKGKGGAMKTQSGYSRPLTGSIEERAKFYGYYPNNIITGTVLTMNDGLRRKDRPILSKTQIIMRRKKSGAL